MTSSSSASKTGAATLRRLNRCPLLLLLCALSLAAVSVRPALALPPHPQAGLRVVPPDYEEAFIAAPGLLPTDASPVEPVCLCCRAFLCKKQACPCPRYIL